MASGSLRRFDVQANYSMILSLAASAPFVGGVILIIRNYRKDLGAIVYGAGTSYQKMLLACIALSLLLGAVGFLLGLSSAGQRRNEKSNRSWMGFFIGGLVCTFDIVLLLAFMKLRLPIAPAGA